VFQKVLLFKFTFNVPIIRRFLPTTKHKYFHENTFYLFILTITCLHREYVIPYRHNVTALYVNMVFIDEDKILMKKLYQLKGYNARQLRTEFPDKGWTTSNIYRLLKKFRDTGIEDRAILHHHRTGSFHSQSHFSVGNKYASKKLSFCA